MNPVFQSRVSAEPILLADAKEHVRRGDDVDNAYLTGLIVRARKHLEKRLGRQLITTTWKWYEDSFPQEIRLPYPPLQSIVAIVYTDDAGDPQTLDANLYQMNAVVEPGKVKPAYNESWPSTRSVYNAVAVEYKAGYGDAATDVPDDLLQYVRLLVAHWTANRLPTGVARVPNELQHMLDDIERLYAVPKV